MADSVPTDLGASGRPSAHRRGLFAGGWSWPVFVLGAVLGVVVLGIGGLVIGAPLVIAHRNNLPLEQAYGSGAVTLAARLGAGSAKNPLAQNARADASGRIAYLGSCSACHGAAGDGRGMVGQATYPPATSLTSENAKEKSDAELFWIVRHGLSFTGMPSFGGQYSDQDIWSLVSYMRSMQQITAHTTATSSSLPSGSAGAGTPQTQLQRGQAVYVAQGCQTCHGIPGVAAGGLSLRSSGGEADQAVRRGRRGMPAYDASQLSDAELADMDAYMQAPPGASASGDAG